MLSAVAKKFLLQPGLNWERKLCLRSRLQGFSCRKCVEVCAHQALTDVSGEIIYDQGKCAGCGSCVAVCPNGAFSFEGLNLLNEVEKSIHLPNLVLSCHRCDYTVDNEIRIPCVGLVSEEHLVYLGLIRQHDIIYNLIKCATCPNHLSAKTFLAKLGCVQKKIGHLFRSRILTIQLADDLPKSQQTGRRAFLFSLGSNAAEIVRNQFGTVGTQATKSERGRRVPERLQLLLRLLQDQENSREEVIDNCVPSINISDDCTLCPRCTGMCPTGALKVSEENSGKNLSVDQRLCSACGLCVEFCKVQAISMSEARIRLSRTAANYKAPTTSPS